MTEQLHLLILAEQTVKLTNGTKVNLLPLQTKDGSLSMEPEITCANQNNSYGYGQSGYCGNCGKYSACEFCGRKPRESFLALKFSKCQDPVMVHCMVYSSLIDRKKLAEKTQRIPASSQMNISVPTDGLSVIIVKIVVRAIISSPQVTDARHCFNRARLEGHFCDVKLVTEGEELPAHRMVLASRSTVLANMLTGRSEEGAEGRVVVADISKVAVEKFLEFLYTDQVEDWGACALELLLLAAEYEVPELTTECTERLWSCEADEALKVLHAAGLSTVLDRPLRRRLTAVVLSAMKTKGLLATKEWKEFESTYPVLAHTMTPLTGECKPPSKTDVGRVDGVRLCLNRARREGDLCDIKLVVEGVELPAHRLVLAARSPVLHKMLTGSFKEATEGRVELVDFSREAVKKFLHYLYTDEVHSWKDSVIELLQLADKYMIPELRSFCELKLWDCGPSVAVKALQAAGYSEVLSSQVRRRLSQIVLDNLKTLADTEEWGEFQTVDPIISDTILGFADNRDNFSFYDLRNSYVS
ncbi:BTB/POZ domain-containing protein [Frankliniella fusca]|uniref:BTB/POZ domain-containing protein n=1 Tax=Frankliniella fusca TaxID=407009 RepID=A0AAE1GRM8_9NEOP|nr:BTB/POZ domain-containing protein [Frankliniella fusca]